MADAAWLSEAVVEFLKGPLYINPLMTFIDQKCLVFTPEEENKLEYTIYHNEFKALVDKLLTDFLNELGVSPEQFFQIVAGAQDSDQLTKFVIQTILTVDDFLMFKAMMVRRNLDLTGQVLDAVEAKMGKAPGAPPPGPSLASRAAHTSEEEQALKEAMALSARLANEWDEINQLQKVMRALQLEDEDIALPIAIARSLRDGVRADYELADIEQAIALSLALDEERRRLAAQAQGKGAATAAGAAAARPTSAAPGAAAAARPTSAASGAAAGAAAARPTSAASNAAAGAAAARPTSAASGAAAGAGAARPTSAAGAKPAAAAAGAGAAAAAVKPAAAGAAPAAAKAVTVVPAAARPTSAAGGAVLGMARTTSATAGSSGGAAAAATAGRTSGSGAAGSPSGRTSASGGGAAAGAAGAAKPASASTSASGEAFPVIARASPQAPAAKAPAPPSAAAGSSSGSGSSGPVAGTGEFNVEPIGPSTGSPGFIIPGRAASIRRNTGYRSSAAGVDMEAIRKAAQQAAESQKKMVGKGDVTDEAAVWLNEAKKKLVEAKKVERDAELAAFKRPGLGLGPAGAPGGPGGKSASAGGKGTSAADDAKRTALREALAAKMKQSIIGSG